MKLLVKISAFYTILGLLLGVYHRELPKLLQFTGRTPLSLTHVHTLVLGMFFFLIVLLLEKSFTISQHQSYYTFLKTYNLGLLLALLVMIVRGTMNVLGVETTFPLALVAGLGHLTMSIGLFFFYKCLFAKIEN